MHSPIVAPVVALILWTFVMEVWLVKLQAAPGSRDAAHWHGEAVNVQLAARRGFSPGMRRLLDVDDLWTGCRAAGRFLKDQGARESSRACPFTLDDLLAADFDVAAATARIAVR